MLCLLMKSKPCKGRARPLSKRPLCSNEQKILLLFDRRHRRGDFNCGRSQESGKYAERFLINADWRFQKGDPSGTGDVLSYDKIKGLIMASSFWSRAGWERVKFDS